MNSVPSLATLSSDALMLVFWLSLPALAVATVIGLLIGLLQSVTQIQDQSLPYGAKIICVGAVLIVTAPWASRELTRFLTHVFTFIAAGRPH
ncbi:Surface presentation of antigens protein SpaQ [Paraburkholderia domus]|jgi:type III secretion protein, HrpO family|uniref:Surface presentation of antigens protein SpaQ n=1 Tax=Paraburkholderia domus TaxID=2793075 RepID=A0A9N8R3B6_9BURK|nr:type III secretion system export apparatus subunit SctS [Paraburkholderia domus]MBK5054163.1 type III secretion system export apparatus subunit SctS [Burkholderia sp. R-70006]MBK5091189.1 type III secretion system export apparatus subunit SctS [Burkholderia sp. R-69927]MBK5125503.1 type III secretion system export apparatus subunit SctS [Burkholderia sp. R-69980]MBK5169644.1 type III secretion system export apparatus subunit SctS [Burkholderia sp. R-70211]MBK5185305.1 type III secretion sys